MNVFSAALNKNGRRLVSRDYDTSNEVTLLVLYKVMVVQTLLYDCVNWALPREHERRLEEAEMKFCALYNTSEEIREQGMCI